MRQKYKLTGFSRFLIFLIFFVPVAYLGASYYNGEDGVQNIKDFIEEVKQKAKSSPEDKATVPIETIDSKDAEILILKERIAQLEQQVAALESAMNTSEN